MIFRRGYDGMSILRQKLNYCPVCGKLYAVNSAKMCEKCLQKEEEKIVQAAEFIENHPEATLKDIMEATKIHKSTIIRMIRSGMLDEGFEDDALAHPCRRCGKPITRGDFCPSCAALISGNLSKMQGSVQAKIDAADPKAAEQRRKNKEANEEYIKKLEGAFKNTNTSTNKKEETTESEVPETSVEDFQKLAAAFMTRAAMIKMQKKKLEK